MAVNVEHEAGYDLLLSMLQGHVASPLPRMPAQDLEDYGILYCKFLLYFRFVTLIILLPTFIIFLVKFTLTF